MTDLPAPRLFLLRWPLLCALAAGLAASPAAGLETPPAEQGRAELRAVAEPGAGAPLRLQLPSEGPGKFALVIIRGLSKEERLTPGISSGDAWYVPVKELDSLRIFAARGAARILPVTALFIASDNSAPVALTFTLRLEPQAREGAGAPPFSEIEQKSLREAARLMKNGDIAAARLIFEDLALQGSAQGAFAMGQSYDPDILARMPVHGLMADPESARRWYEKARRLASRKATPAPLAPDGAQR